MEDKIIHTGSIDRSIQSNERMSQDPYVKVDIPVTVGFSQERIGRGQVSQLVDGSVLIETVVNPEAGEMLIRLLSDEGTRQLVAISFVLKPGMPATEGPGSAHICSTFCPEHG